MDAIIFDIDGTLADISHRRHFVAGNRGDWKSFFESMSQDKPTDVCLLAEIVAEYKGYLVDYANEGDFALFICSGRPEEYREITETWLQKYVPSLFSRSIALLMRQTGDYRPDTTVKREMLQGIRGQGYEPRLVVDDRPSVISMWKSEGLTVLEVDSGEWDAKPQSMKPGLLTLLVGPSGAGKSTHAMSFFKRDQVISSDSLREQLTGDFRNQAMNEQVFAALHAIVKTRIENGLDTCVDATNLRAADRRKIRDLVPQDCQIVYVVIDRPLHQKLLTAGWRSEVQIKGKSLIETHHESFRSGLKHILAGDSDPRVIVVNMIKE